jgi:flagellin
MSSSILTNASALTALEALNMTQNNLQTSEDQVSTGLKVQTAADNAAYWSIATKMTSQNDALGAVSDALNESGSLLSTMTAALNSTITIMDAIQKDLIAAEQPGADFSSIQTDIAAQQTALISIGQSANFNGQNFLDVAAAATSTPVGLVASFTPQGGVTTINVNLGTTQLFDSITTPTAGPTAGILGTANITTANAAQSILTLDITDTANTNLTQAATSATTNYATSGDLQAMLAGVASALGSITTASSTLGATTTNIDNQQTFISTLSDSLTTGVGSLVDADMNEASTRLSALQVQQQLGIQALSIANNNTQLILKLFE